MGFDPNEYLKAEPSPGPAPAASFDPHAYAAEEQPGMISHALERVSAYTDAPARAAIMAGVQGKNPFSAGWEQLGKPADSAPTGKDITTQLGVPDENVPTPLAYNPEFGPSDKDIEEGPFYNTNPAGASGAVLEAVADPKNLILPAGRAFRAAGEAVAAPMANYLGKLAMSKRLAATGLTGLEKSKLPANAGQVLKDLNIVPFGSSQADIAENAAKALEKSGQSIGSKISGLAENGVSTDRNKVLEYLRSRRNALSGNEGEDEVVSAINKEIEKIQKRIPEDSASFPSENAAEAPPPSTVPIDEAEKIRGSLDRDAKYDMASGNATRSAKKAAAGSYRQANEEAAAAYSPEIASEIAADKDIYHSLKPIVKGAQRRAAVTSQSPPGGLLDTVRAGVGHLIAGRPGAVLGAAGGRYLSPMANSSLAASADFLSGLLKSTPEALGRFGPILSVAAARGGQSLMTTDKILRETNPEYRQKMESLEAGGQ